MNEEQQKLALELLELSRDALRGPNSESALALNIQEFLDEVNDDPFS